MINYVKQDLCEVTKGIVAHGVNCQSKMGSGVAGALKKKYPKIYPSYMEMCNTTDNPKELLGVVDFVKIKEDLIIVNCFTQEFYGYDGKRYADPDAIYNCMRILVSMAANRNLPIYIPKIGCGLGGLDWDKDVKSKIEEAGKRYPDVDIFVCDL